MHPLLLFTLLFLPGIKSFNELDPVDRNDGQISITDIAPIQEPQIDKTVWNDHKGHLKPYERHIAAKFKNNKAFERGNDLKYSVSGRDDSDEISHDESHRNYKSTPSYKYDIKEQKGKKHYLKDGHKENVNKYMTVYSKKHFDENHNKGKHLKDGNFELIEKYKHHKNKNDEHSLRNTEKGKRFHKGDKKEDSNFEKHFSEYPALKGDKYKKNHYSDEKKYRKHEERFERVKRQVDVSEESSESEPDEEESNESSDDEKYFMEHLMVNGYQHESQDPYKDYIEVDVKRKSNENGEKIPVKEPLIKKTVIFVSCNEENGIPCSKVKKPESEQSVHENDAEHHDKNEVNYRKHDDGEVDETWLRRFEESILKDAIDVEYHPQ